MIILNFKAYKEAIGSNAEKLAQIAKEVGEQTGVRIIVAPQTADIVRTSPLIETIAQHVDPIDFGFGTGFNHIEAVKQAGATGSLLNHSEHKISIETLEKSITKLKELGMKSFVCAEDPAEAKSIAELNPDYIAIEPPELIGSGISVSKAKPEVITESIKNISSVNKKIKILCGAGISGREDVEKALKLGATGVLLASAFTKAGNPKKVLIELASGFKRS